MLRIESVNDQSVTGALTASPVSHKPISPRPMRTRAPARLFPGAEGEDLTIAKFRANKSTTRTTTISPAILQVFMRLLQRNLWSSGCRPGDIGVIYNNR